MTELCIAYSKFHFRKDLGDIETSQLTDSVNRLTGFFLILPFTEKICLKMSLIRYIRLNLLYLLNLIRGQFYFINYQDSCKAAPLYVNIFKIDVLGKKGNNKYLCRSSLFSEVTSCRPLAYFNFPAISMLIKMRTSLFQG